MKFRLEFDCDNAAFGSSIDEREEAMRAVIKNIADNVEMPRLGQRFRVRDINGNTMGFFELTR